MSIIKQFSFWHENSAPDLIIPSQLPNEADMVIIGAGFTGIVTAYWLLRLVKKSRRKKIRIIVLDKSPFAGYKSSGRMNGSIYLGTNYPNISLDEKTQGALYRYSSANNLMLRSLIDRGIDCDAEFNGGLKIALTDLDFDTISHHFMFLEDYRYYPKYFNDLQLQNLMVSPYVQGAIYIPNEGMFDPFAFTTKLARLLRQNGVFIVYGTEVENTTNDSVHLVNGHVIKNSKIVHTTPSTIPDRKVVDNLLFRREHVIRTDALVDLDDSPLPLMPIEMNNDSVRMYEHSIIMTGGKTGFKKGKDTEMGIMDDTGCNQYILANLDQSLNRNFPVTRHIDISHTWSYIETLTTDNLPIMGLSPSSNNHYINIGHDRNKFGLAFLGAKNIAEKILRVRATFKDEFKIFDPKRFK